MQVGFGLEKLGLCALRSPKAALVGVCLVTAFFIAGITQLQFSSELREIFRSDSPHYETFRNMTKRFPGSERDVFILVEGDDLFTPEKLEALRVFQIELRFVEGVRSILSIFSARMPVQPDGSRPHVLPDPIDGSHDLDTLRTTLLKHPLVANKLMDKDGRLALYVVALAESHRGFTETKSVLDGIRAAADEFLGEHQLTTSLTGMPVVRVLVIDILTTDQLVFKLAAYTLTLLLSWLFFRSFRFLALAVLPPVTATIWLLGGMGWAGQDINVVTNVIPNLVMVITFANSIHLLVAIRRHRAAGIANDEAVATAVREIGPATVLTSLTTAIALLCLLLTRQPTIVSFASTAAYGTGLAFIVVMAIVPPLARVLLAGVEIRSSDYPAFPKLIDRLSARIASFVTAHPAKVVICGLLMFALSGFLYFQNGPHFRYRDNLPANTEPHRAMETIDERLAGTNTLRIMIEWPETHEIVSAQSLALIRDVHDLLKTEPAIRDVWSLHGSAQWIRSGGWSEDDYLAFIRKHPEAAGRFLSVETNSSLVTGQLPDIDASDLMPMIVSLEHDLEELGARYPGVELSVTGIAAQSARSALVMIERLNRSLLIAVAVIIVLIALALRSVGAGLVSIMPNLLPIAMAGTMLYLTGRELQFTSIIVFAIGFGIAVDSTIHMLNHYRQSRAIEGDAAIALANTVRAIGPALIISTIALMSGGVTLLSPLPMAQLYGQLMLVVLATALVGDILILPGLILLAEKWRLRIAGLPRRP